MAQSTDFETTDMAILSVAGSMITVTTDMGALLQRQRIRPVDLYDNSGILVATKHPDGRFVVHDQGALDSWLASP